MLNVAPSLCIVWKYLSVVSEVLFCGFSLSGCLKFSVQPIKKKLASALEQHRHQVYQRQHAPCPICYQAGHCNVEFSCLMDLGALGGFCLCLLLRRLV